MTDQLKEIGMRLRALREIMDMEPGELAEACRVDVETYERYERGEKDFSFSFLYNAANALGVDVVDLMSGESPRLSTCSVVRAGRGFKVERNAAYSYEALAFTFRKKRAEPFHVTVYPANMPDLHGHEGQEFQYLLKGEAEMTIGESTFPLHEGDAVYFDSAVPHALRSLNGEPAEFIAVVIK